MTPDLKSYDRILVAFSGGKDSLACLLKLLKDGVPLHKIELHHHDVDGDGRTYMDWRVTRSYCEMVARHLGLPIYFSYKKGGFEREMNREQSATAPNLFEIPGENGEKLIVEVGGKGPEGTRLKFPQLIADLSKRWCSAYLKIDVMDSLIRNQDRFLNSRTLVVTGERAEESASRSRYKTFEPHRTDTRDGTRRSRHVDHWRPIHDWKEAFVWEIIREFGIVPHVAYQLGWSRLSCLACIFGSPNQWATILHVFRERFELIEATEASFDTTIRRSETIRQCAARGTPYAAALANPNLVELANQEEWNAPIYVDPSEWQMPAGAFGENAGPV